MTSFVWLITLTSLYVVILAAITVLNWCGADRWWFGVLNLYLPQAIWLVPGILLAGWALKVGRHWVILPVLCVIWVLGPIMGFCLHLASPPETPDRPHVRIMTCNIKSGRHDISALIDDIVLYKPEVVLLQDAEGVLGGPLGNYFRDWNVRSFGQYVVASRLPLGKAEVRTISIPGEQTCMRCLLHTGTGVISLYNVHFMTPREGLNKFRAVRKRPEYLPKAIAYLENNVETRLTQARAMREFIRQEQGPVIVAGDLNSPDASQVCAILRDAGLHDAFAEGGSGYGYTYGQFLLQHRLPWAHVSWMRIDHIMVNSYLQSRRCWTGTGKASDHRPVIADLTLR